MVVKAILETIGVLVLACLMAFAGWKITRREGKAWIVSFFLALPFVLFVILLNRIPILVYSTALAWVAQGRVEFMIMATCMPFIFGLLIPRLSNKRQRFVVGLFVVIGTGYFIIMPFLDPVIVYAQMKDGKALMIDDVYIQSTNFTCGAASAVTALRQFGIEAVEAEMALAASTSRAWGTSEHMLAGAIERMYSKEGIHCEVRTFDEPTELIGLCPVIVIVKYRPLVDHYVTVLEADKKSVLIGDPLAGKERLTHEEFTEKWRQIGIVISKDQQPKD